jgi:hypothetical protein
MYKNQKYIIDKSISNFEEGIMLSQEPVEPSDAARKGF